MHKEKLNKEIEILEKNKTDLLPWESTKIFFVKCSIELSYILSQVEESVN
jgi:hypothetical protein